MPRGGGETVVVNNDGGGLRKKVFPPTPLHHTREGGRNSTEQKPPSSPLPFPARPEPKRARLKYLGMQVFCRAALPPSLRPPSRPSSQFPPFYLCARGGGGGGGERRKEWEIRRCFSHFTISVGPSHSISTSENFFGVWWN